jgi:5'-3' exonuclease
MGIEKIWDFLRTNTSDDCRKTVTWDYFAGKSVAFDGNWAAYLFKNGEESLLYCQFAYLIFDCAMNRMKDVIIVFDGDEDISLKRAARDQRRQSAQKIEQQKKEIECLLQTMQSSVDDDECIDIETVKKFSPLFFSRLKTKRERESMMIDTVNSSTIPQPQDVSSVFQGEEISEEMKEQLNQEQAVPPAQIKMDKEEWLEQERQNWSKKEFLSTILEKKKKVSRVTKAEYSKVIKMLRAMGACVVIAEGEAESYCSVLSQMGIVDYVVSEDSDCFAFGAKKITTGWRGGHSYRSKREYIIWDCEKVKRELYLTNEQFILMCSLCKNDYNKDDCRLYNYGIQTAYKDVCELKDMKLIVDQFYAKKEEKEKRELAKLQKKSQTKTKAKPRIKKTKNGKIEIEPLVVPEQKLEIDAVETQLNTTIPSTSENAKRKRKTTSEFTKEQIEAKIIEIKEAFSSYWVCLNTENIESENFDPEFTEAKRCIDELRMKPDLEEFSNFWNSVTLPDQFNDILPHITQFWPLIKKFHKNGFLLSQNSVQDTKKEALGESETTQDDADDESSTNQSFPLFTIPNLPKIVPLIQNKQEIEHVG